MSGSIVREAVVNVWKLRLAKGTLARQAAKNR
jgi:hypothetical protein